eukprot:Colp12_sorted_trinity150504_noHs@26350
MLENGEAAQGGCIAGAGNGRITLDGALLQFCASGNGGAIAIGALDGARDENAQPLVPQVDVSILSSGLQGHFAQEYGGALNINMNGTLLIEVCVCACVCVCVCV